MDIKRNSALDFIRVLAMMMVILDHYFSMIDCNVQKIIPLRLGLGGGGVTIFCLISAMLFGTKWAKDGYKSFEPIAFFKKRCIRIYIPLWITILIVLPFEYTFVDGFNLITVVMNFVGLGWLRPFGLSGHLWYITLLMLLYVCFVLVSHFRLDKIKWYYWTTIFLLIAVCLFLFQDKINTPSKAAILLETFFSILIFSKGREMLKIAKQNKLVVFAATIAIIALSQYIFSSGLSDIYLGLAAGSFICAAFMSFLTLYICLYKMQANKVIKRLSDFSYEIYLVHAPFILICMHYIHGIEFWTPVWISTSLIGAIFINRLSKVICNKICMTCQ